MDFYNSNLESERLVAVIQIGVFGVKLQSRIKTQDILKTWRARQGAAWPHQYAVSVQIVNPVNARRLAMEEFSISDGPP